MIKTIAAVVGLSVIVLFGVGMYKYWMQPPQVDSNETTQRMTFPVNTAPGRELVNDHAESKTVSSAASNVTLQSPPSIEDSNSLTESRSAAPTVANSSPVISKDDQDRDGSASEEINVVGHPFAVSASIETQCNRLGKGAGSCEDTMKLLSEMAQEKRNPEWATAMETELRDFAINGEPNKYSIRNIECRTSLCAFEVESIYGPQSGLPYPHPLNSKIYTLTIDHGYEINPAGSTVTVTLLMLRRN